MKTITVIATLLLVSSLAGAAGTFVGGVYTENFDSIGPNGTAAPANWTAGVFNPLRNRVDTIPDNSVPDSKTLQVSDGGYGDKGVAYNYGSAGAADRAIGWISTTGGWSDALLQVELTNNTGVAITTFELTYTGEQWRNCQGDAPDPELIRVHVSKSNNSGFTKLGPAFEFTAPSNVHHGSGAGDGFAMDGNAAGQVTGIGGMVDLVAIGVGAVAPNENFFITFHDWNDDATRDHGIAVDDVSVVIPEPATMSLLGLGALALIRRRRRKA